MASTTVSSAIATSNNTSGQPVTYPSPIIRPIPSPTTSIAASSSAKTRTSSASTAINKVTVVRTTPTSSPTQGSTTGSHSSSNRLANGTVAGIVIGVAVGIGLLTFLATFFVMRQKRGSGGKLQRRTSSNREIPGGSSGHWESAREPKGPIVMETGSEQMAFGSFLPQSADDKTVKSKAKTTLEQIELHVESFYLDVGVASKPVTKKLATFDSPHLPSPISTLLEQSKTRRTLIRHSLAQYLISSISLTARPESSLLPTEFALLPRILEASGSNTRAKPGFDQSLSRWRVLTAYLRPSFSEDRSYMAQRADLINNIARLFSEAFDPWKNPKYADADRAHSLSAIMGEVADLGIFIFSQPSLLQFQWPGPHEISAGQLATAPALIKLTDERGNKLREGQVLVDFVTQKL